MARPNTALLLTGGGARAAYQVGALKAIAELYPRNLGIPFPILCGTSAGAINVTALACYASCFHLGCASWSGSGAASRLTTSSIFTRGACCGG